jgi:GNAT superfamily N-acetyltransferase
MDIARTAEGVGFDRIGVADHVWQHPIMGGPEANEPEGYATLAFLAARTERAELGAIVSGIHFRYPGVLAKTVTTLDVLSGGRAALGIGAGHYEEEARGLGIPFPPLKGGTRGASGGFERRRAASPQERTTTVETHTKFLKEILATGNSTVLLAEEDGKSVGFLEANGGAFRPNRHVVHVAVGVLQEHARRGIGTALLAEAERWAREAGLRRMEHTVGAHDRSAMAIYEKTGFVVEGARRGSMLVKGNYVDEYYMAKVLD